MKFLSLIVWVTQFGVSLVFPLCFFMWLGFWLMNKFGIGGWVMVFCGVIGFFDHNQYREVLLEDDAETCRGSQRPGPPRTTPRGLR